MKISSRLAEKLLSLKMAGLMKGLSVVKVWARKR